VIALKENNQLNTALQLINELIRQYPTDIRSQQLKGELAFGLKMFEESSRCYEELIRMSSLPENTLISN
jgi:tetratricopeptide (TPR) repeat protein